jgi:membrane protease YdiL (CAAX protease family)
VAVGLTALAAGTIWLVLIALEPAHVPLLASTLAETSAIAIVWIYARSRGGLASLGLRRAKARFFLAAVLLGVSVWLPTALALDWIYQEDPAKGVRAIVEQSRLLPTLLVLAILPAVAEELVFRGVLARGLATTLRPAAAIAISAVAFAVFHLSPIHMLGVLPLAFVLGFVAQRADSVLPVMLLHAANNATAILVSRRQLPGLREIELHRDGALGLACVLAAAGLALAWKDGR